MRHKDGSLPKGELSIRKHVAVVSRTPGRGPSFGTIGELSHRAIGLVQGVLSCGVLHRSQGEATPKLRDSDGRVAIRADRYAQGVWSDVGLC